MELLNYFLKQIDKIFATLAATFEGVLKGEKEECESGQQ